VKPVAPLLSRLQSLIEASYDWRTGIPDVAPYLVGDQGYKALYADREILEDLPGSEAGPRTLVTSRGGVIRLGVYYPDALVRHLEDWNPLRGVTEENIIGFSLLVEELDHLLMLAWCVRYGRRVRLVELEFHANVTKYLVLAHFLGRTTRRTRLLPEQRKWLRHHLFWEIGEELPKSHRDRYRTAALLARRYIQQLETLPPLGRITALRRFVRQSWGSQRYCLESAATSVRSGFLLAF